MPRRPNILWICTDQQRWDTIHGLGNPRIRTPNLDRLADEGVSFTSAYSQSPICTPSRASFLTGRYPRTTRARQNGQKIPDDEVLISRMLADEGYDCGLVGKLHLAACDRRVEERIDDGYRVFYWSHHPAPDWPENAYIQWMASKGKAWDELYHRPPGALAWAGVPAEYHQTTWCAEKTIDFLAEPRTGPWLMSVNPFDPHHAFDPPEEYLRRYDPDDLPSPAYRPGELEGKPVFQQIDHQGAYGGGGLSFADTTDRQHREVIAAYYAMVELVDDQVGRILRALDETGQREDTLVIFTSDHGEMLGDHGIFLKGPYFYEPAVHVPLIISWPGRLSSGLRSDALVELVDLVPTLLQACGLEVPERIQGKSLFPICGGQSDPSQHRDFVQAEYYNGMAGHRDPAAFATMWRNRQHKIVVHHGTVPGELYDLEADPGEFTNLWDSTDHPELKLDLMAECFDASVFTMDPVPPRLGRF